MLDIKRLRNDFERIRSALMSRGKPLESLDTFVQLDKQWREQIRDVEQLKNRRNVVTQEIARMKKNGENADTLILEMRDVSDQIKQSEDSIRQLEQQIDELSLMFPNVPNESVPIGVSEEENIEIRRWGQPREVEFTLKAHWEVADATSQ